MGEIWWGATHSIQTSIVDVVERFRLSLFCVSHDRPGRVKMKMLPLCPRVIRIDSSMYPVLNHPVGPKAPSGMLILIGDRLTTNLHA
jgi:hypothetical protein